MPVPKLPGGRKAAAVALALSITAPAEGMRQVAYRDPGGILTVCEGYTGRDIDPTKVYAKEECRALTVRGLNRDVDTVDRCLPGLPVQILAAFSDAVYNLGPVIACDPQHSRAARLAQAGDYRGACNEFPRWDKVRIAGLMVSLPGLTTRRAKERDVCLSALDGEGDA